MGNNVLIGDSKTRCTDTILHETQFKCFNTENHLLDTKLLKRHKVL